MPSFAHKKIIEQISQLDLPPDDPAAFSQWLTAAKHLAFLDANARSDETIIYACGEHFFVHSLVVPNEHVTPPDQSDLLKWNGNPFTSIASYVSGGGRKGLWIERGERHSGSKALDAGRDLVFGRTFAGWTDDGQDYFELNQEYTHLTEIHWRPEHGAYCKYDGNGDLAFIASVAGRNDKTKISLVSFNRDALDEYLAISDSSLVRMFDFQLLRYGSFTSWSDSPPINHSPSPDFFYYQKLDGGASYTRGIQIVRPRRAPVDIMNDVADRWSGRRNKQYVEFIAHDWRNDVIAPISTDPTATTNYFDKTDSLPFELSPAYFRPEVLSKYKTDREKYTVGERTIDCRAAWHLRGYDVNEAGQVHAYICDLRTLPYAEQLHWLAHNEEPKAGISERAVVNDFKGEFVSFEAPLQQVLSILKKWRDGKVAWWKLRAEKVLDTISAPISTSQDEWSDAFMDLSKLIAEGFDRNMIRERLDTEAVAYPENEQSIALLERLLGRHDASHKLPLSALRTIQLIRSKVKGHAGSSEAKEIVRGAIAEHGSLAEHFKQVCVSAANELQVIENELGRLRT